ncbi:cytochrome c biogenesis protein CcmG/thiol:disulfide interchange protein DsbE [Parabacteroides sp. PF5-5]|uniref:TlpA family protein disulfide reductase n=1 Tax=unclassified Parabacteroides TaxID=2649774 RepID=UPI0024769409|nr:MULTISPECIES: TlpA disulfide reductase family protein [unclassified Parabacteroides]MDH6303394.1 cytochrome c biogenesis protein CcmG/thiol:disulfide interchange protein DsbE [Parabacteroides sp. PH5-39]MDH6314717.1 cytochrome c biogenesis protein CcmG/thiol:disulfide interchange protein DsbE [Parabacteroides sp. PF5-13]MDH6318054.1 cytochrome c biogenesis protein CcmG/thiol:disulfide interchange protein DsbE [Parabacteroides sp. PH5-13]MDH6322015.1 cytochrome c biogenesis protein CcmG/thiol
MKKIILLFMIAFAGLGAAEAQLPSVELKDVNGKRIDISKLPEEGHPLIISFFATWCKPCQRELSAIHEVYADWQKETGVELVVVSIDDAHDIAKVKPMIDSFGWNYTVLLDASGDLRRAMKVNVVPYVFVVAPSGKIVYKSSGYTEGSEKKLINEVRKLAKK